MDDARGTADGALDHRFICILLALDAQGRIQSNLLICPMQIFARFAMICISQLIFYYTYLPNFQTLANLAMIWERRFQGRYLLKKTRI